MDHKAARKAAWLALRNNWRYALPASLSAVLLGGCFGSYAPISFGRFFMLRLARKAPEGMMWLMSLSGAVGALGFAYLVVCVGLGGLIRMNWCRYQLELASGCARRAQLFGDPDQLLRALVLRLLTALVVAAKSCLLILPGLVSLYRYALAPALLAADPELSPADAMRRSRALMKGHKWGLFELECSYLGFILASAALLWIPNLVLVPWMASARGAYLKQVLEQEKRSV